MKTLALILVTCLLATNAFAQTPVTIALDSKTPGAAVPDDFLGFSYEMQLLLPGKDGKRLFSPDNKPLADLYKQLGIKNMRVGGNTSDVPAIAVPGEADIDSLFAFAKLADVKVDYTLRARGTTDFAPGVKIAKYLMDNYKSQLVYIAIGNEPNVYAKEYPIYRDYFKGYTAAVTAVAPDAMFSGPGTTPGKVAWATEFAKDFGPSGKIKYITQHSYPGSSARRVADAATARELMLSTDWIKGYQKFYDAFAPAALENKIPLRLEEANSFFHGGVENASDTLTSALWGLDYMHWWAAHDCAGINFHTGDNVAAGDNLTPCRYATYWTSDKGNNVHPLGYAIKAFDIGGRGQIVNASLVDNEKNLNITAYGILAADKSLYITVINKEHGDAAQAANVTLVSGGPYTRGDAMFIRGPKNDIAATAGVTLGGAEISDDAKWTGTWTPLAAPSGQGQFKVELPPASAVVVKLTQ